jgi:hypothetical protein
MGKKAAACSVDGGMGGPELEQGTPVVDVSLAQAPLANLCG